MATDCGDDPGPLGRAWTHPRVVDVFRNLLTRSTNYVTRKLLRRFSAAKAGNVQRKSKPRVTLNIQAPTLDTLLDE